MPAGRQRRQAYRHNVSVWPRHMHVGAAMQPRTSDVGRHRGSGLVRDRHWPQSRDPVSHTQHDRRRTTRLSDQGLRGRRPRRRAARASSSDSRRAAGRSSSRSASIPTAPDLHLGHTVLIRKMKHFQDLGHTRHLRRRLVHRAHRRSDRPLEDASAADAGGDSTHNAETYKTQIFKILDPDKTEVRFNSEWLEPLGSYGWVHLAAQYNVAQMLERREFKKRYETGQPIAMHEFLYPLAQAYDSVYLEGGRRARRHRPALQPQRRPRHHAGLRSRAADRDDDAAARGARRRREDVEEPAATTSASTDAPSEMFGKLMSISDELMWKYYTLLTDLSPSQLVERRRAVDAGALHPKQAKIDLATTIVTDFHGAQAAERLRKSSSAASPGRKSRPTRSPRSASRSVRRARAALRMSWSSVSSPALPVRQRGRLNREQYGSTASGLPMRGRESTGLLQSSPCRLAVKPSESPWCPDADYPHGGRAFPATSRSGTGIMVPFGSGSMTDDSAGPRASMSGASMSGPMRGPLPDSSMTLLLRARQGDERARNELCARYLPRLRRWAHGRLPGWARDHLDTEDIVQDTLLSSIRRLESFSPRHEQAFCAYLCQAIRNRVSDAVRRAGRRPLGEELPSERATSDPSPFEVAVGRETVRAVRRSSAQAARIRSRVDHRARRAGSRLLGDLRSRGEKLGGDHQGCRQPRSSPPRRRHGS